MAENSSKQEEALTQEGKSTESSVTVIEKQVQKRIFKIIVIGDSNVGKTCLTFRFCIGKFPDKTEATIGVDFREKTVDVDNEQIKVIARSQHQAINWSKYLLQRPIIPEIPQNIYRNLFNYVLFAYLCVC